MRLAFGIALVLAAVGQAAAQSTTECLANAACKSASEASVAAQKAADEALNLERQAKATIATLQAKISELQAQLANQPAPAPAQTVSLWPGVVPNMTATGAGQAVELGMKFQPYISGHVLGLRFYRTAVYGGTQTGRLWSESGAKLGEVTFPPGVGWVEAKFAQAVPVSAHTTYVASFYAPSGWQGTTGYWTKPYSANGLTATVGVYKYSAASAFPTSQYTSNYWVDVLFGPTTAPGTIVAPVLQLTTKVNVAATATITNVPVGAAYATMMLKSAAGLRFTDADWLVDDSDTSTVKVTVTPSLVGTGEFRVTVESGDGTTYEYPINVTVTP